MKTIFALSLALAGILARSAAAEPPLLFEQQAAAPADGNPYAGAALALQGSLLALGTGSSADEEEEAVYLFEGDQAGGWLEVVRLADGLGGNDGSGFGQTLALEDGVLVVGAPRDEEVAYVAGAVHVFERDAGGPGAWGRTAKLLGAEAFQHFGDRVAVARGRLAVVSSPTSDDGQDRGARRSRR